MRSKSNIDKIKTLCDELNDRDLQLKVNAKTLWIVLEKVEKANSALKELISSEDSLGDKLKDISSSLNEVAGIINERGCKRV